MDEPIVVNKSTTLAMFMTLLRYGLTAAGTTLLVNKGIMSNETMQQVVGGVMAVVPGAIGTILSRREMVKLHKLTSIVPDSIAHLK